MSDGFEQRDPRRPPDKLRVGHHGDGLPVDPDLAPDDPGEPSVRHRPGVPVHRARQRGVLAVIGAGGFVGTLGRYGLERLWSTPAGHFPWATFTVNASGSFLLGVALTVVVERSRSTYGRPFLCTGVIGAWTTMSTFVVEAALLIRSGDVASAAFYVVATVCVGVVFAGLGIAVGRRVDERGARCRSR